MNLKNQAQAHETEARALALEEQPVFAAPTAAVDLARFRRYSSARYADTAQLTESELLPLLEQLKLLGTGLHPTALGSLLFSSEPSRWIAGAYVDLTVYDGPEPVPDPQSDAQAIRGTVVEQIEGP